MYEKFSSYWQVTAKSQLQYLDNLYDGEENCYYSEKGTPIAAIYDEAKQIMTKQYNNATTKIRTRQILQNISSVMDKEKCDVTVGLEKVRDITNKLTPLEKSPYLSNYSKVE